MIRKIKTALEAGGFLRPDKLALVAVSGGADSICLLHAMLELSRRSGMRVCSAHLNHRIRGKNADMDEAFVEKFAKKLGVPILKGRSNVPALAKRKKISLEMAAREARYSFLEKTAKRVKADFILTAHTANDQAETVILKLARGAGPGGMAGIAGLAKFNGIRVVRPMLNVTRDEIIAYLKKHRIPWREDESNSDSSFLRNRVRMEILPLMEKRLSPSIRETLVKTADIFRQEDAMLNNIANSFSGFCLPHGKEKKRAREIDVDKFRSLPSAIRRRIIRTWLVSAGVDDEQAGYDTILRIESLATGRKGSGQASLPGMMTARREYGRVFITRKSGMKTQSIRRTKISREGDTVLKENCLEISCHGGKGPLKDRPAGPGHLPAFASISRARLGKSPLFVRSWRKGDRMRPLGLNGSRKLQDIFVDAKVPHDARNLIPIFECRGEIVWIPGYRIASGWELKDWSDPSLIIRVKRTVPRNK